MIRFLVRVSAMGFLAAMVVALLLDKYFGFVVLLLAVMMYKLMQKASTGS